MVTWPGQQRCGPIGVDIGSRWVKLLQMNAARTRVCEAARWDLPAEPAADHRDHASPGAPAVPAENRDQRVAEAIRRAREGRNFRGRDAVLCLGGGNLFVQNIRVAQASGDELTKIVHFEAAGRLPFGSEEAEVRYIEADDVKQGDTVRREVILLACRRPWLDRLIGVAEQAGLRPVAVDVEPMAVLRCYGRQFRRDDDQERRMMFVTVGASSTVAVIARGTDTMFVKYIDIGGRHFDEAVAKGLKMTLGDAAALRRHNADRQASEQDPEIARSLDEAVRPTLDGLAHELSLCLRYYSVTFRGQPLQQMVLGGGEATGLLAESLSQRLELPCELGNPLRPFQQEGLAGRAGQWDIAAGLALKEPE